MMPPEVYPGPTKPTTNADRDSCFNIPSGPNVVIAIKTGASEASERIPALMQTHLRCAQNLLIFSDLSQDIGKYHIYDALDTVSPSVLDTNPDFGFYKKQQEIYQNTGDINSLKGEKTPHSTDLAAWTLDKYKFLHVLEKSWVMKPDLGWYILIDADTYIFWTNLLSWLSTLDPDKKSYFGSEVVIESDAFAHGGSGIVLSRAAMYDLVVEHNGTAEVWDEKTWPYCCGDLVLGVVMRELGIVLKDVWPLTSGETITTIPFGPGTPEYTCRPALTMHHVTLNDMKELIKFERGMPEGSDPITHLDVLKRFVMPSIRSSRKNWDNLASDPGEFGQTGGVTVDASTFADCTRLCEADTKCFQFTHHGHTCYIGMSVRLGHEREPDVEGFWESGWNQARLEDWVSNQPYCDNVAS